MLEGSDKLSDFPEEYNKLEKKVQELADNTRGIKWATWIAAIATAVMAFVAVLTWLKGP